MEWLFFAAITTVVFVFAVFAFVLIDRWVIYKHQILVRTRSSGISKVKLTRAKEIREDGVLKLKLLYPKKKVIDIPPKDCLGIGSMGNYLIEAFLEEDGSFSFIEIPTEIPDKANLVTPNQRLALKSQYMKAEIEGSKNMKELMLQFGLPALALMVLTATVVVHLVFWNDIGAPLLEKHGLELEALDRYADITSDLKDIREDSQELDGISGSTRGRNLSEVPS